MPLILRAIITGFGLEGPDADKQAFAIEGETLALVAACDAQDVDFAVGKAREAFDDGRWRTLPPATSVSPTCPRTSSMPAVGAPGPRRRASAARLPRAVSDG